MQLSAAGAAFVRHHEGFVDHYYLDPVAVPTIGVGFTWLSTSFREWWGKNRPGEDFAAGAKMTRDEADDALRFMCEQEYGAAVNKHLGTKKVAQHVFDGAVSPVYNLGPGSLKWKWAVALKAGDVTEAAKLLRTTGTTAKGKKLNGLIKRRKEEAELLALGDYTVGKVYADPMDDGMLIRGERGFEVLRLQKVLKSLGHYTGVVDGKFGIGTEAAVLSFQRAAGLKPDGWAGPATIEAINAATTPAEPPVTAPAPDTPATPETPELAPPSAEPRSFDKGLDMGRIGIVIGVLLLAGWAVFTFIL